MTTPAARITAASAPTPTRRVLDLRDSPWVDGPGRTILDTAAMADPARFEIVVGAFAGDKHGEHAYLREAARRALPTWPIAETRALDFAVLRNIVDWCRAHNVEIIHTHDFRSDLYGLAAARRLRIPVVSTCHGWIANNRKGVLYTRFDQFLQRFFDRVIAVSERMRGQLIARGVPRDKITLIQNALIVENYRPDRDDKSVRRAWGVPDTHKVIAKIGRLSPEKRQDLFLQAAARILESHPRTHFVLIGIGPEQAALEKLAKTLDIQDRVTFAGFRKDMQQVYNSIDLVVQSSLTEGMPNVILEALLMRVPVVATDVGGTAEIVEQEISGLLIPAQDLDALVAGIDRYLRDPALFERWTDAGERRVRTTFSHKLRVQRIMDVYEHVLRDRVARARI